MNPTNTAKAQVIDWVRKFVWMVFPPSNICLYTIGVNPMFQFPFSVGDWVRMNRTEWIGMSKVEFENYCNKVYREELALGFHGILFKEVEESMLCELRKHQSIQCDSCSLPTPNQ